jgi:hypothetical protein
VCVCVCVCVCVMLRGAQPIAEGTHSLTSLLPGCIGSAKDAINVEQAFKALIKEALTNNQFEPR